MRPSSRTVAVSLLGGAALLAACRAGAPTPAARPASVAGVDTAAVRRDVAYLASDALEGRATGTPGNDSAAAYIARRYASLGLAPLPSDASLCEAMTVLERELQQRDARIAVRVEGPSPCTTGYLQRFGAKPAAMHAGADELRTQNVVALVRGTDRALRDEYVVLGAHFDHLGRSRFGALDPDDSTAIRRGADDNASGTAAVMELARLFRRHPPRRSVVVANFTGEELGLLGSAYFVEHAPVPLGNVVAMLNFDMVGRLRDDKVIVYGTGTARELPAILDSANAGLGLALRPNPDGYGPSDHSSFYAKDIPVLHFFTDVHDDYHRASDRAEKVNVAGEGRVIALAERVARAIADRPGRLSVVHTAPPQPASYGGSGGPEVYLGSIPDMAAGDVAGTRLTGVRAGSPAERAGLKPGDVIVELDGKPVTDLQTYSDALFAHRPGDVVSIVVLRAGQRLTLSATLGKRGG